MPLPVCKGFDLDARPSIFKSPSEWAAFWTTLGPWFAAHGYSLHTPGSKSTFDLSDALTLPARDTPHEQQQPPYAFTDTSAGQQLIYDNKMEGINIPPFVATCNTGRVYAAQDSLGRHICIKLVRANSEQLRVVELLRSQRETPGVLPVLNVLRYDNDYAFIVMPRWGDIPGPCNLFRSVSEVVEFVVDVLQGLRTLHELRIAHRDIKINNMVLNHLFPLPVRFRTENLFTSVRETVKHRIRYAIIDFDFAMIVPPGISELPSSLAWMQEYSALDVAQGELFYDPFAYDVGVLGVFLCEMLQKFIPSIPPLAPLLDRMTTHELNKRFTGSEAHEFAIRYLQTGLTSEQLSAPLDNGGRLWIAWNVHDRWEDLPDDYVVAWSAYRTPPVPTWMRYLRQICMTDRGLKRVQAVRRVARVFGFPLRMAKDQKMDPADVLRALRKNDFI